MSTFDDPKPDVLGVIQVQELREAAYLNQRIQQTIRDFGMKNMIAVCEVLDPTMSVLYDEILCAAEALIEKKGLTVGEAVGVSTTCMNIGCFLAGLAAGRLGGPNYLPLPAETKADDAEQEETPTASENLREEYDQYLKNGGLEEKFVDILLSCLNEETNRSSANERLEGLGFSKSAAEELTDSFLGGIRDSLKNEV